MPDICMPRLSDSMEEGTIVTWLVADGDEVEAGDAIAEVESDKATVGFEAEAAGVLRHVVAAGETVPVGTPIARIVAADGAGEARASTAETGRVPERAAITASGRGEDDVDGDGVTAVATQARPRARPKATPVARRVAQVAGIDLESVIGSGPHGRVVRADVEQAAAARDDTVIDSRSRAAEGTSVRSAGADSAGPVGARGAVQRVALSRLQTTVARRMSEAKATIPEFSITTLVDMDACIALREQVKQATPTSVPSLNDMVVKASAAALRAHPRANGSYRDGHFDLPERVNVGIAVAAADALTVPTIFDADRKSLMTISAETARLAARVREGAITPPELSGGTFTVSNLGMYGVTEFTAVVNPPQAAILAVGALRPELVLRDGAVASRQVAALTLTCDHRILYGADAARFLSSVRELLEQPVRLLL